jgi:hypothetical protein
MSTTVLIQNEWGGVGTGFFVFKGVKGIDDKDTRVFLVTNKHNISDNTTKRDIAKVLNLYLNIEGIDNVIHIERKPIYLKENNKTKLKEHKDINVDVLAVEVTELFGTNNRIAHGVVGYDTFINHHKSDKDYRDIGLRVGDDVLIIGYPQGRTQSTSFKPLTTYGDTVLPIVRQGMISTPVDGKVDGLPAFLIDGGIIPGSSGSPVVVRQRVNVYLENGHPTIGYVSHSYLLGIIASTTTVSVESNLGRFLNLSNIGMAFNTDTIVEVIDSYYNNTK